MDDSMCSTNYMRSQMQCLSSTHDNSSEESGWTLYFEDFLASNNNNKNYNVDFSPSSISSYKTSSVVLDAHREKNEVDNKKLMSKHRKAKTLVDEELEDTASSPSHCHNKINNDYHMHTKSKHLDIQVDSREKGGQNTQHGKEAIDMGFLETQLKRKGLCLVPMSMLLNHL